MNVRFEYLYRDAGNFKNWGEIVFFNPLNINAVLAAAMVKKSCQPKALSESTSPNQSMWNCALPNFGVVESQHFFFS